MNKKMRELLAKMEDLRTKARKELESGETAKAAEILTEYDALEAEYSVEEKLFKTEQSKVPDVVSNKTTLSEEEKTFVDYVRGTNKALSFGANGAVIPKTVANKIIDTVKELSPILKKATIYYAKGTFSIPVYGTDGGDDIQAGYATEFTDLTAHAGKFTSVDLSALVIGALTKISKSFVNNTDLDVLNFVINKIAKAIADFLTKEAISGTGAAGKMTGIIKTTNVMNAGGAVIASITADKLIDMQLEIPEVYQPDAYWTMSKAIFKHIRKFKDSAGDYILVKDFSAGGGWLLLGKPVHIDENMPAVAADAITVAYGDMSGLAIKLSKDVEIQVLNELYAVQNAIGVVGWVEADSKIENAQKFVVLKMAV